MESQSWLRTIWEDRRKRVILGLSLFLIVSVAAVYAQTAGFAFVDYDDPDYVVKNPRVPGGLSWDGIKWAFTTRHDSNWFPLVWLSLMLDRELFGVGAGGFHLVNTALHIASTVLLFWVLRRYSGALWSSFFVAALFGLHPLHVESVAWVAERKDVLSTLFWMLTMLAYIRYVERPVVWRYVAVCVLYALGLMAKSMLVTLPFVLLVMDYWPLRRLWPVVDSEDSAGGGPLRLIIEKTPLFVLSAASCVITFIAQKTGGAVVKFSAFPLSCRLSNTPVAYCDYILKMFWPVDLAVYYPHPGKALAGWKVAVSVAALLIITIAVILLRRRRYLLAGWLWYLGTLVPVIGLVQVGGQAIADRYTYIPLTGLFIMLVWLAGDIVGRLRHRAVIVGLAGSALIGVLGLLTFTQVRYWQDTFTLFTHTAAVTTRNSVAHNLLGVYLARKGDIKEAMHEFEEALKIAPRDVGSLYNFARALAVQGRSAEAVEYYNRVLVLAPGNVGTYVALASMQADQGNFERAMELYREGLRHNSNGGDLHDELGSLLFRMGRVDEAIAELETAAKLKADSSTYCNLGKALALKGQTQKAIECYKTAIMMDADNAEAHYNLGNAYSKLGRLEEAVGEYKKAIKARPNYAKAYGNLAIAFSQMGRFDEAIEGFRRVVELEPNDVKACFNLAAALAERGLFDDAITEYEKGLKIDPNNKESREALKKVKEVKAGQSLMPKSSLVNSDSNL